MEELRIAVDYIDEAKVDSYRERKLGGSPEERRTAVDYINSSRRYWSELVDD